MSTVQFREGGRIYCTRPPADVYASLPDDEALLLLFGAVNHVLPEGQWYRIQGEPQHALGFTLHPELVVAVERDPSPPRFRVGTAKKERFQLDVRGDLLAIPSGCELVLTARAAAHLPIPRLVAPAVGALLQRRVRDETEATLQRLAVVVDGVVAR